MSYYREQLSNINKIYDKLLDEESRILFDARINYLMTGNEKDFFNGIKTIKKNWYSHELEEYVKDGKKIILYGSGADGIRNKEILSLCNYKISYFLDSDENKSGTIIDGIKIISIKELIEEFSDSLVIISSRKYFKIMYEILLKNGFNENNILLPENGILVACNGVQYFDVFQSSTKEEIFVDAGSFNGDSTLDFMKWADSCSKKVYAFEPLQEMYEGLNKTFISYGNEIEIYNYAVWDKKEILHFIIDDTASRINEKGEAEINGISIDDILKNKKVTYIKMDIEGSELKALQGARKTIISNQPKLAICIYHKAFDVIELANYILSLNSEYKFYIRHYTSCLWETVLYAVL